MQNTMELLNKALNFQKAARWCESLNLDPSVISQARKRGNLSPALAGNIAMELGEDAEHWIAIAAIEGEKKSPLLDRLKKSQAHWRKLLLLNNQHKKEEPAKRVFLFQGTA